MLSIRRADLWKKNGKEPDLLVNCYKNCLKLAEEKNIRSIVFCAISTGVYGYPEREAAKIAIQTVKEFCVQNPGNFDRIIFACFDDENYNIYSNIFYEKNY